MVGLLITGHGHFATGMGSALKLVTGNTEHIAYVEFEEEHSTETLTENLNQAFEELKDCDGVLVLADLAGGSPFKCAVECKFARPEQAIEVVAGANLPMMVEGSMMMGAFDSPLDLADSLIRTGQEYIVRFELGTAKEEEEQEEDGI